MLKSYNIGDKFILTISAACQTNLKIDVEEENTLTHLSVRITEKDYSFIMPINEKLKQEEVIFNYLNPLRANYVPRVLETDGVKLSIQDLVISKLPRHNQKSKFASMDYEANEPETKVFDLIFQVDNKADHKQVNLDSFANIWKNFSVSNFFSSDLNSLIEREPVKDARHIQDLDGFETRPFYLNWLFWLLCIIGILLIIILIFFVCCIKLTRKQSKYNNKQSGIVIEYPQCLNPVYRDGKLNFKQASEDEGSQNVYHTKTKTKSSRSKILPVHLEPNPHNLVQEYEDQELEMFLDDDSYMINQDDHVAIQQHHENK